MSAMSELDIEVQGAFFATLHDEMGDLLDQAVKVAILLGLDPDDVTHTIVGAFEVNRDAIANGCVIDLG